MESGGVYRSVPGHILYLDKVETMNFSQALSTGIKEMVSLSQSSAIPFNQFPAQAKPNVIGGTDAQEIAVYDNGGVGWVSSAINRKMIDISNIDFHFKDKKGKRVEYEKLPEELAMPFQNGWAGLTHNKMAAIAIAREDLSGNDIWVKSTLANRYTEVTNKIGEFMMVPSGSWNIIMKPDYKSVWYYIVSFGATVMYLEPKDVIHFRSNPVINPFIGIGLISQARATVESEIVATEYENNFLVRDGSPNMVVVDKSIMNQDQAQAKANEMRKKYGAGGYRNNLFYAAGEVTVSAFQTRPKDAEYIKPMNRELIISIMQSTPAVLGLETSAGNRAIADRATQNYFGVVNSRAQSYCDTINHQFVKLVDKWGYELTFTPYPTGDIEEIKALIEAGLITINEGRRDMGREVKELDPTMNTIYLRNNYAPIGQIFEGTAPQIAPSKDVKKNLY